MRISSNNANKKEKKWLVVKDVFLVVLLLFCFFPIFLAHADVTVNGSLPQIDIGLVSSNSDAASIPAYITRIYQFAIGISGIVAVGMIVAGAIMISASAGNTSLQGEGRDMITSAIWGLVLLFGAYLILNAVNPGLVLLREPQASVASSTATAASSASGCNNCVPVGVPTNGNACQGGGACIVNQSVESRLQTLVNTAKQSGAGDWYVTEAYPPTVAHISSCHDNGTCVDVALSNKSASCDQVQNFLNAISAAGFSMANEYYNCPNTNPVPHKYDTTTGQNVHIY